MKTHTLLLLGLALAFAARTGQAATEQWTAFGDARIQQVVADGNGGCAYTRLDASNNATLVWLDKKGNVIYQAAPTNQFQWPIVVCTRKLLLYLDKRPLNVLVQVAPDGTESVLSAPNTEIGPSLMGIYRPSLVDDRRGFFAVKLGIPVQTNTLLRFTNK